MCSRQYVAQVATGCSAKGKTIAMYLAVVFFINILRLCKAGFSCAKQALYWKSTEGSQNARLN
jgi:hypothetical protein